MTNDKALNQHHDDAFASLFAQSVSERVFGDVWVAHHPFEFGATERVSGAEKKAPLDNRGATFPEEKELHKNRSNRWRLKHSIAKMLRKDGNRKPDGSTFSVCGCGYAATVFDGETKTASSVSSISLSRSKRDDGSYSVGVSGALRCGSPWMCPTCAVHKAEERRETVAEVIDRTNAIGGVTAFVTLTVRHSLGQSLKELKQVQSTASRKARQGRAWTEIKSRAGVLGVVQGVEVLHNDRTGWHYHSHLAVPCSGGGNDVLSAMEAFVSRYIDEVRKAGGEALMQGQDIQLIDDSDIDRSVAEYISKGSASWEIAGSLKEARGRGSKSPWDLATLAGAGDEEAEKLFVEYCHAMAGTRTCVISAKLAEALHMSVKDDDELPTIEGDEGDEIVVEVLSDNWRKLMSYSVAWQVVQAVELGKERPVVSALVDELVAGIDHKEAVEREKYSTRPAYHVPADELAESIIARKQRGMTWLQAERSAVQEIKRFKRGAVMPSSAELGRAVARLGERHWAA